VIFRGISTLFTFAGIAQKKGRFILEADLSPVSKAAIVVDRGMVQWVGPEKKLPREFLKQKHKEIHLGGSLVYPALTECHTHLIYDGNRAQEFEWRNTGVSYLEIASRGGGILSTMTQTRKATKAVLAKSAQKRVDDFLRQGVTTIEVKSGYALSLKDELKCLEVARDLKKARIVPTFLGAHAKPPEFATTAAYLEYLADKVLPSIRKKKLAERVDIFVEKGFFESADAKKYLEQAKSLGFQVVLHADQLTLSGGTAMGLELEALSVDHVIQINDELIRRLGKSQTTAVLLPAADLYMRCKYPPARQLLEAGAQVALATDTNPGTSPTQDTQLVGVLARLEMKMTLPEVFAAYTYNAASALRLTRELGSLEPQKQADFYSTDALPAEHFLSVGKQIPNQVFKAGQKL